MSARTTCGQCLAGCGMIVDGARVSGDPGDPVTRGYLCANGRASVGLVGHPGRLSRPLLDGAPASWDAALGAAAAAIARARDRHGPDSVGLYFGAGDPAGSMAFLAAAGFMLGLGSRTHYNVIGLEATHRNVVAEAMFGSPLAVPRADLARAGGLLAIGTNPPVSNDEGGLAVALRTLHERKAATVVLDPRRTELARKATLHLPLRPGTDPEVLLAMLHVLFEQGVHDRGAKLEGLDRLRALAAEVPPSRAAAIAGVAAEDIARAARLLSRARPIATISRLGAAMTRRGTLVEWLAWAIAGCLGGLGGEGGLVHNPGFLDLEGMLARAPRAPGSIIGVLPPARLADSILRGDGPRALVVVAADLVESVPNTDKLVRALRALDALIVLDVMPTPTTELARVVLPCAHHLEKDDVAMLLPDRSPLRYARASAPIGAPPGEARTEVAILADLAHRLRRPLFGAWPIDAAVRVASALDRERGERYGARAAMKAVLPLLTKLALTWSRVERGHLGPDSGRMTDLRSVVTRPRGLVDLAPPRFVDALRASLEVPRAGANGVEDGALVLSTCNRSREFINTKLVLVGRAAKEPIVHLSPADAARLGLAEGAAVDVETKTATLGARVHVDDALRAGTASMFFGTPGLNRLTDDADVDPLSGIPALANVPCRVVPRGASNHRGVEP